MTIEKARIEIERAFEEAETISDFKMRVHNIIGAIYFYNELISFVEGANYGYIITETGGLINQ